jgi:hypothetical protein
MFGDSPSRALGSVRPTRHERDAHESVEGGPDDGRRKRTSGRLSTRKNELSKGHTDGCAQSEVSEGERGCSTQRELRRKRPRQCCSELTGSGGEPQS